MLLLGLSACAPDSTAGPSALAAPIPDAQCPRLDGTWKSDRDLTMAYLDGYVKLGERQREGVNQLMGRLVVTFDGRTSTSVIPAWTIEVGGEKREMHAFQDVATYETLHCNDKAVVTRSRKSIYGREQVTIFNFDRPDEMWVYVGGADSELPDSSFREYFRRQR